MTPAALKFRVLPVIGLALITLMPLHAAPPSETFAAHDPSSTIRIDHSALGRLLGTYLDADHPSGINRFDYAAVGESDLSALNTYLAMLEEVDPAVLNRDEQMAYWINFYNALTLKVVLDHYPVAGIRDISLPGSRRSPWKVKLVRVNGADLSLDDMEHGILRPLWADKRIHYAVNCASLGCPNLASRPYTTAELEDMLEAAARDYVNHPRGVSSEGRRLRLSSIYDWYGEDFGTREELTSHLLQYAEGDTAETIRNAAGGFRFDYDWRINAPE